METSLPEVGISVLAGYKYSTVHVEVPSDYEFGIDHQERSILAF